MENETDKYLEAARIVAECKPSKLPYVLAILREGGINMLMFNTASTSRGQTKTPSG